MAASWVRGVFLPRQVLLLVLAVTLPCVVIVALGLRLVGQERELAEKRTADERRRVVAEVRQELLARLSRIRTVETTASIGERAEPRSGAVVFAVPLRAGQIVPPWEPVDGGASVRLRLETGPAASHLQAGNRLESRQPLEAAHAYRLASRSEDPLLAAHARFAHARALARTGRQQEADTLDALTAAGPWDVTDEYGMPLAVYAAQRLAERRKELPAAFLTGSRAAIGGPNWPSPATCYALQQIATVVAGSPDPATRQWSPDMSRLAVRRAVDAERVIGMQHDVTAMLPRPGALMDEPRWFMTGSPSWLVSATPTSPQGMFLIAVDAARLPDSLPQISGAADVRLVTAAHAGEPLGDLFPGVRLAYAPVDPHGGGARIRLQRWFYAAAAGMVLGVTGLGVFLLWRDVRREMRLGAMRAQFVASVSHELKTPLTSIRMFAETLRMGRGLDDSTRTEYLDTIINESERLTRLLNNVLDFSRIEQEKPTYRRERVDLRDVIRTAARTVEYPLAQERFDLHLALDETVPPVEADPDAIQQAILNLLTNAMKYSGPSRRIELALTQDAAAAVIVVTDYGSGIAAQDRPRLFERFYRGQTIENQHIPGAGLGLTIVQHIVEAHGGNVAVDSVPGEGSTFRITLPLTAAGASAVPALSEVRP